VSEQGGGGGTPAGPPSFPSPGPGSAAAPAHPETAAYPPPPAPPLPTGPPSYPGERGAVAGGYGSPGGSPGGAPYATWAVRLGGYLIDAVIFLVVLLVLVLLFRHSHALNVHLMARRGARRRSFSAVPFLITGALWVVYGTVLCGGPRGQTVGMMAAGVRAVGDEDRGVLGYGRAFGRALVEGVLRLINLLFFVLGLLWVLDMLFPLWDKKRQTLHDKVAGSVVIRTRPPG
jgi:uncharacterized RDD family membrane protein YckC